MVVGKTSSHAITSRVSNGTVSSNGTAVSSQVMTSIKVMVRPKAHGLESQLPLAKPAVAGEASLRQLLA